MSSCSIQTSSLAATPIQPPPPPVAAAGSACTCHGASPSTPPPPAPTTTRGGGAAATDQAATGARDVAPAGAGSGRGASAPTSSARQGVLMIGDSLGVGTAPYLRKDLEGPVDVDAVNGRSLATGMKIYDQTRNKPRVVEMGLFTNDDPRNVEKLRAAVERTIADARARGGRVVWATIHRKPVGGVSYDAANSMLRTLARENADVMGLVDWDAAVRANRSLLTGDGVHGTAAGYRWRAQAFADEARR